MLRLSSLHNFNSSMVQLKGITLLELLVLNENFNSSMVQLKASDDGGTVFKRLFQFLYGTIKSPIQEQVQVEN